MSGITKVPGGTITAALGAKVGKSYLSPIQRIITVDGKRMTSQDIAKWKRAIDAARSETTPRRDQLYEMYESISLDAQIISLTEKFIAKVANKKVLFMPNNKNEGMDTTFIEEWVLNTPWFREIIKARMMAEVWGHSLVELVPNKGYIDKVVTIERRNVVPERAFLAFNYSNLEGDGIYYLDDAKYKKYTIDFGGAKNYGKLMSASQYIIYKRGDVGDWAQFNELFGMPFREFRYNPFNPGDREKLDEAAKNTSGAGYVVLPDGTTLTFHANNSQGAVDTYEKLASFCNEELAKLFLGNTLTTQQGDNGARSLGEVHQSGETELMMTHIIETEHDLNWRLKDKLIALGYSDLEKGNFHFNLTTELPLEKRILIDVQVSNKVPVPDEYWYETYGIPRPDGAGDPNKVKEDKPTDPPAQDPEPDGQGAGGSGKPKAKVEAKFKPTCCGGMYARVESMLPNITASYTLTDDDDELIRQLQAGSAGRHDQATFQKNARRIIDGLMGGLQPSMEYGGEDTDAAVAMQLNIQRFAFTKSVAQTAELNRVMKATATYEEFRQQAAVVLGTFNDAYLRAEYEMARTVGQTTRDWMNIQANIEAFPFVRYKTVGDANVRPAHAALDNVVFRADDRSAAQFNPPNGYGCRCWLEPVANARAGQVKTGTQGAQLLGVEYGKMKDAGFAINRADTGEVFDLAESYVQVLNGADTSIDTLTYADAGRESFSILRTKAAGNMPDGVTKNIAPVSRWGKIPVGMGKWEILSDAALASLNAPDEVYMQRNELRFIKFYKNAMAVSTVKVKDGKLEFLDWNNATNDSARKGLLIA